MSVFELFFENRHFFYSQIRIITDILIFNTKINFLKKPKNKIKKIKEYSNINNVFSLNLAINFFKSAWRFES